MEEKPEPYLPIDLVRMGTYDGRTWWHYKYYNYRGLCPWYYNAIGDDELAAYLFAIKELNKLKRRADKCREKKEQTK